MSFDDATLCYRDAHPPPAAPAAPPARHDTASGRTGNNLSQNGRRDAAHDVSVNIGRDATHDVSVNIGRDGAHDASVNIGRDAAHDVSVNIGRDATGRDAAHDVSARVVGTSSDQVDQRDSDDACMDILVR